MGVHESFDRTGSLADCEKLKATEKGWFFVVGRSRRSAPMRHY